MTKLPDSSKRQFGWIDFEKREPPFDRTILTRMQIATIDRPKYGGVWYLPQVTIQSSHGGWLLSKNGGFSWTYVWGPEWIKNKFQWRDIPGTPMRQAIQMAKLAQES